MDARPILIRIARLLEECKIEAILIGNTAAALQGAPVTTVDFDFMFRKTPANVRRLKDLAKRLDAMLLRPYYPASGLLRISRDEDGLQLDFMGTIDGVRSFESLRSRAHTIALEDAKLLVAALADIVLTERTAGQPPDRAVMKKKRVTRKERLQALKKETELALIDQIRRWQALPPDRRTNFLRKRISYTMSAL